MKEIGIVVTEKIATVNGTPLIVCDNSDYTIKFTFDTEWAAADNKIARFSFLKNGLNRYIDVPIENDACNVPILSDIEAVAVGAYAGNLQTTTGAVIKCKKSILSGGSKEDLSRENEQANAVARKNLSDLFGVALPDNAPTLTIADSIAQIPSFKYLDGVTSYASWYEGANFPANTELTVYVGAKVESLLAMFASATNLKKVKLVGDAGICDMEQMFASSSVEEVDFSGLATFQTVSAESTFATCNNLVRILGELDGEMNFVIWGFENCPKLKEITFKKNSIVCDVNIPDSPDLTTKSVQSIIDGLNDTTGATLYLHSDVLNRLTEAQKKEITDKGWSVV